MRIETIKAYNQALARQLNELGVPCEDKETYIVTDVLRSQIVQIDYGIDNLYELTYDINSRFVEVELFDNVDTLVEFYKEIVMHLPYSKKVFKNSQK